MYEIQILEKSADQLTKYVVLDEITAEVIAIFYSLDKAKEYIALISPKSETF